ncbi:MAG: endonuclease III domain-containing protein [Thermoplasmatota archaeon]
MSKNIDYGEMIRRLKEEFQIGAFPGKNPDSNEIPSRSPFKVLISTILSQRTKDANTHKASKALFEKYDTPEKLASAPIEEVKEMVRPAGFYNVKSERVIEAARIVKEEYDGEVPEDLAPLMELPGVGRKTANCVLVYGFGEPAVPVDTHVHRISNRLGIADTNTPEKTEEVLVQEVPREYWIEINRLMVEFGKNICRPRNPKCDTCPLTDMCDYYEEVYLDEDR